MVCAHRDTIKIKYFEPESKGCEECLKSGDSWVHLRICLTCGHVG
ncbi:ubiquitin carboxyl-terminal hydrolase family protein, partial [Methanosarcina horonobensis]